MRRARSYSWYPNRKIGPRKGKDQETGLETELLEVQDIHQDKFNLQEDCQNQVLEEEVFIDVEEAAHHDKSTQAKKTYRVLGVLHL